MVGKARCRGRRGICAAGTRPTSWSWGVALGVGDALHRQVEIDRRHEVDDLLDLSL